MKLKRGFKKRIVAFTLCLIMLPLLMPGKTSAQEKEIIKVGFFSFDGYHMQEEDGTRSGYGYDMLQHMAGYTDWEMEYVGYDKTWSEMQEMLESGEIDLLTSAHKTNDRTRKFDFSEVPIGTSKTIVTVNAGDTKYSKEDYSNWNDIKIGLLKSSTQNINFAAFAKEKGFKYIPIYYDDVHDMVKDLKDRNNIEAIVTSNLRSIENEWILAEFDTSPFYVIVKRGNIKLLNEVNQAIADMDSNEPEIRTQLMNKYYALNYSDEISFTAEERAFINEMKNHTFSAVVNPDHAPYSFMENEKDNGIIYDIAQEIIRRSQLNVNIVETKNHSQYSNLINEGKADIQFDAKYNLSDAENRGYCLTLPYLKSDISKLYNKHAKNSLSVALIRNGDVTSKFRDSLLQKGERVVYYDTTEELINAVLAGKQTIAYLDSATADYAVQYELTNSLISEKVYGYGHEYAVAVKADQDKYLYSIINKAVISIQSKDIDTINQKYTSYENKDFSLIGYIYDYPTHILGFILAVCLFSVLVIILAFNVNKRRKEREQLSREKQRNGLLADALLEAEKADEAKSQFLSRVSHEMRTPLNAIIGFLELAKESDKEQIKSYLNNASVAAKQLLSVINDVLDMASIESGKMKIASSPFDFKQIIRSITSIYLPICQDKNLKYETVILTPLDEWLIGDQLRLNQILMNLLGNAVKFTNEGSVELRLSQYEKNTDELFIHIEVSDTGCGMSTEMKERLFKPFEQENAEIAQKYGGSGLGLSIVKNLVNMMDGIITVQSIQNQGTTFTIEIPFTRYKKEVLLNLPEGINSLRVLAVDDEENERNYLSTVLNRMGVYHTCVANADEAINELVKGFDTKEPYNICLIDWKMPHINGIEATKNIRAKFGKDMVVIVVSAYEQHQADENAREAGANLFISKPLFQSTLFDLFMNLTGGELTKIKKEYSKYNFSGKRVLLAEDNAMNQIITKKILEKLGVVCESAENGNIVVNMFLSSPLGYYDAILMDIQMPDMDGYEATKAIRNSKHPDAQNIQIIALTANAFNEDIARTLSAGMNAHVSKPIEPDTLAMALDKAFKENK